MNIPYTYLAVLLVFTLLIGVVIGDRLAAGGGGPDPDDGMGGGRSGGCSGLASARLHECVHRHGYLRTAARKSARSGAGGWPESRDHGDLACELPDDYRDDE